MAVREVVIPVHSDVREVQRLVQQQLPVHIGEAGVTVPARLHDSQRQATIDAGACSGLVDLEEEVIASAAAAAAGGSFRATRSRSLAAAAAEHCWALYRQPRIVELYRLDADDQLCGADATAAGSCDPFWGTNNCFELMAGDTVGVAWSDGGAEHAKADTLALPTIEA